MIREIATAHKRLAMTGCGLCKGLNICQGEIFSEIQFLLLICGEMLHGSAKLEKHYLKKLIMGGQRPQPLILMSWFRQSCHRKKDGCLHYRMAGLKMFM
ncbi:MAG: hypothetical protein KKD68_13005 [Proteobacteria bacterium]|nr:hypothetical protein [Pseudomonadota bacterium]